MAARGLFVLCPHGTEDWPGTHQEERTICFLKRRPECHSCDNSRFTVRIQARMKDQRVLCPRWELRRDYEDGLPPSEYVEVSRAGCFGEPLPQCARCPNRERSELPRTTLGWWEDEARARKEAP